MLTMPQQWASERVIDILNAWCSFGTLIVTALTVLVAWREFRETTKPQIIAALYKLPATPVSKTDDNSVLYDEFVALKLRNIGNRNAYKVQVKFLPGIPWPMASRPAGDPQPKLYSRSISCLPANESVDLMFAVRTEFEKVISNPDNAVQHITVKCQSINGTQFTQHFNLDLRDIWYLTTCDEMKR